MVDYVELQYATMLSNRLKLFKIKSRNPYRINFRCPECGDSQTSKSKARGWLLESKDQTFVYYCHNCGISMSFHNFLKSVDPYSYKEFLTEKFIEKHGATAKPEEIAVTENLEKIKLVFDEHPLKKIKKISQLKYDHPAKKYIDDRKIPPEQHYRIFYAPKFKTWVNSMLPDKLVFKKDEPRIVLPFLDKKGNIFGFSGRGFDPNGLRYMTIMLYDDKPKIFGLDKVDFSSTYYVTEGAIDSLFLHNAVAMAGADGNTDGLENIENAVFVFDLEYRNKEIMKRVEKVISKGVSVCLFPQSLSKYGKDLNEFVLNGLTTSQIQDFVKRNTYKGLAAKIKLIELKKC